MTTKIGVVIQGPWMPGVSERVIEFFSSRCEVVLFSGWQTDEHLIGVKNNCKVVINKLPANNGFQNRNLQRISTYAGLKKLLDMGCTHGLKWRSDIIPRNINFPLLLREVNADPRPPFMSRLVMSSFRVIAINADWLSTLPDLYMFGRLDHMLCMWGCENLSMESSHNMPELMRVEMPASSEDAKVFLEYMYNPHAELYAIYKDRLLSRLRILNISAKKIFSEQLFLDNYLRYRFDWFGQDGKKRSVQKSDFPPIIKPFQLKGGLLKISKIPIYDLRIWYTTTALEGLRIIFNYKKNIIFGKIRSIFWSLNFFWQEK